ncbi:hypothetical protein H5410_014646 [Solanum commersonii]|uniref:Uncharacterized protein n=1 Tax=Solanum commersonii TaxID=4109 RepID=A0A9J5ZRI9_SOLCO|nr:hypothetical protein H5410_014646 [Solanum commersonii]
MLDQYSNKLHSKNFEKMDEFLMKEITVSPETEVNGLPNLIPVVIFLNVLKKKVKEIAASSEDFVGKLWNCLKRVIIKVLIKFIAQQHMFMDIMNEPRKCFIINIEGVGVIDVGHLRKHLDVVQQAFDLNMRMMTNWKIVLMRLVDSMALHLMFSIQNMINKEMEDEIVDTSWWWYW